MAGRERSGAVAARGDLFEGRAWVVAPAPDSSPDAVAVVESLGRAVGAAVIRLDPTAHDAAVAAVSHLPQVAASLVAARLRGPVRPGRRARRPGPARRHPDRRERPPAVAPDPRGQRAAGVAPLRRRDLRDVVAALMRSPPPWRPGTAAPVPRAAIAAGNRGRAPYRQARRARTPPYSRRVSSRTRPGRLARAAHDAGEAGVNLEDLHLEHVPGSPCGVVESWRSRPRSRPAGGRPARGRLGRRRVLKPRLR